MSYCVDIVNDINELKEMKCEWNTLLQESSANTPFLTWEWIYTWWDVYGKNQMLYVITVRSSEGHLFGIAPLKIDLKRKCNIFRLKTLEFIGTGGDVTSEYMDFIIKKGHEKEVVNLILENLWHGKIWKKASLRHYSSASMNLKSLKEYLSVNSIQYKNCEHTLSPITVLSENIQEFLSGKSRNFKKKMKEFMRVAARDLDLSFYRVEQDHEVYQHMKVLRQLHRARWKNRSRAFRTEEYIEFHERIVQLFFENDWLRMYFLKDGFRYISGIYCLFYGKKIYYYQSGRDPAYSKYRPGFVLLMKTLNEAMNENAVVFDFLTGKEEYKLRWATDIRSTKKIVFHRK